MFDIFCIAKKTGLFPHERVVNSEAEAQRLSRTRYFWIVNYLCDYSTFDFLWEPVPWEAYQRHAWPSQWQKDSGTYLVPKQGYTDTNYRSDLTIKRNVDLDSWDATDLKNFDYSWHPDYSEPPLIYQFGTQHQQTGGPVYRMPGAVEIKYVSFPQATKLSTDNNWIVPSGIDTSLFDFTWHPDDRDPPYIYQFGTQHQQTGGPRYVVPGATNIKYISSFISIKTESNLSLWEIPNDIDTSLFDFTWHPDDRDPPYIYQFGTQHQQTGGPRYVVPGAVNVKYISSLKAIKNISDKDRWDTPNDIDVDSFDFTWHPDDRDPPYIYQFGTQHQQTGGPRYVVPGATNVKYISSLKATKNTINKDLWEIPNDIDCESFDFTWHPDDRDTPYIYQFGTQHQQTGGPRYVVPGAVNVKYVDALKATRITVDQDKWEVPDDINHESFDFTWHPDARDTPYIYQFGTQHQRTGGPRYVVPGATDIKFVSTIKGTKTSINKENWEIPNNIDPDSIDYTWHPDAQDPPYIYQFGTQHQQTGGPVYRVPGATEVKYVLSPRATITEVNMDLWEVPDNIDRESFDFTWHPNSLDLPYIYQFGTQHQRTGGPVYRVPGATTIKFVSMPRATKTTIDNCWEIPENVDTSSFDFTWHPDTQDDPYIYQFGTQHQRTGGPRYCVPNATEVKYVDQIRVKVDGHTTPIYGIDHIDGNRDKLPECVKVGRFVGNYLDTLRRIADSVPREQEFIWIVSSVCDYTNFDFSWHPEQWQASMLHVFASNEQKFGDTFFMHVPTFKDRNHRCELLEWYDINFIQDVQVPRHAIPVYQHEFDSQVDALKSYNFTAPLVEFARYDTLGYTPAVNLWRQETRAVTPLTPGACNVIIPRDAQNFVKTQIYDYPKIDKSIANWPDRLLDIVFIANGEPCAERHWQWLQGRVAPHYGSLRLHRVDGVNGRAAAYKAAAAASETDWFFAVFAKLEVDIDFPWDWQPDRLQAAKHYIFHAKNPVNGLEYGHQAMIAYNKRLVMANPGKGLDFTLDDAHEVVPILSGVAQYNYTPWMAWRTAFREVLKLKASLPDMESAYRIKKWCAMQDPDGYVIVNEQYSVWGALDAIDYYDSVNGDFDELKKSYEWDWLASYAFLKRSLLPDQ